MSAPLTPQERFQMASGLAVILLPLLVGLAFLGWSCGWEAVVLVLALLCFVGGMFCHAQLAFEGRIRLHRVHRVRLEDLLR